MKKSTPLQTVNEKFGSKEKLIEAVVSGLSGEDDLAARVATLSNKKLLRLKLVIDSVNDEFGSKDKLVEAIAGEKGQPKDKDYTEKLASYSLPKLLDMARAARKRQSRAS